MTRVLIGVCAAGVLAGCGGMGIGGDDFGMSNPAYAGSYVATFHNATDPDLSFTITLSSAGLVSGSVTEAGTSRTAAVTGSVSDWFFVSKPDATAIELQFTFPSDTPKTLDGSRGRGQAQPWPFTAGYRTIAGNALQKTGSLVLTMN